MAFTIQTRDSYYPLKEALQVNFGCSTVVRADLKVDGCGLESYWVLGISPPLTHFLFAYLFPTIFIRHTITQRCVLRRGVNISNYLRKILCTFMPPGLMLRVRKKVNSVTISKKQVPNENS